MHRSWLDLSAKINGDEFWRRSGVYFFVPVVASRRTTEAISGNTGGTSDGRLRPDDTIVPRNSLIGDPLHRTDLRITRRFRPYNNLVVEGIAEVFNLFNHANFGTDVTAESNAAYGKPAQNVALVYQPRMAQFGLESFS